MNWYSLWIKSGLATDWRWQSTQSECKCHHLFVHRRALTRLFFPLLPVLYLGHYSLKRLEGSQLQLTSWGQISHFKELGLGSEHLTVCKYGPFVNINLQNMILFHNIDEICRLLLWAQQTPGGVSPEWVNPSLTWTFGLSTLQQQQL